MDPEDFSSEEEMQAAKDFEKEQNKSSELTNADTLPVGVSDIAGNIKEQKDSNPDLKIETKETSETVAPMQAHDNWRESWYAKYSKAILPGSISAPIGLLSIAGTLLERAYVGPHGIVGSMTGVEQLAVMFGPAVVAEIADRIPRVMVKIEEIKERKAEQKEYFREICVDNIARYQKQVSEYEETVRKTGVQKEKFISETPDPESQKEGLRHFGESEKFEQKWLNQSKKELSHWETIFKKKFREA